MKQTLYTICAACLFFISCGDGTKNNQDRAQGLYNQSIQYQNVGDLVQAEEKISDAIKLKADPSYVRKRVDIYMAQSRYDRAYADLQSLKDSSRLENHDVANLIIISYVLGFNDESISYCNQRINQNKNDFYALFYRAVNNENLLKYKEALEDLNYILSRSAANYYGAYLERGNINATLGLREQAMDDYLKYIEYDSDNNIVYSNIGLVYFNMGRADDALKYYKESLRRKDSEAGLQNMALYYDDRGDYSRALDYYGSVIEKNGNSAFSFLGRGELFLKLAKKQEARASFAKAERLASSLLEKNDKDATLYLVRANAYRYLGEQEKSTEDYHKVDSIYSNLIDEFPKAPRLYRLRGEMFMQKEEYQKAYDDFDKSFKMDTLLLYTKKLRERAKANLQ